MTPEQRARRRAQNLAYYNANKEQRQATKSKQYRLRTYNLTPDAYDNLVVAQNHACAICKRTDKKLHIDHCHVSGQVRGLLCMHCNTALGHLGDSLETLNSAIDYLKTPQQQS